MGKEIGMIFNKETAAMGRIHVCSAGIAPCDDPEDQMVVSQWVVEEQRPSFVPESPVSWV